MLIRGQSIGRRNIQSIARMAQTQAIRQVENGRPPRLEGIRLDDRYAVIFSPDDLSCALEEPEPTGCEGYSRIDAARLAMIVLLYSLHR